MQTIEHSAEHAAYIAWLSSGVDGKSELVKTAARTADAASHAELKALARMPCNHECADCTAIRPGWATLPHGAFICIDCAQLHRGVGRHISQVKAFNTGTYLWFPAELALMRVNGNAKSNALFCGPGAPPKPRANAPAEVKAAYVHDKYVLRRWYAAAPPSARSPPQPALVASAAPQAAAPPSPPVAMIAPHRPACSLIDAPQSAAVDLLSSPLEPTHAATTGSADFFAFSPQWPTAVAPPIVAKVDSFAGKKSAVLAAFGAGSCGMRAAQSARAPGSMAGAGGSEPFFASFGL